MPDETKHTPLPWKVSDIAIGFEIEGLVDGRTQVIAQTQQLRPNDRSVNHVERKANTQFIVAAVNSHEKLVEAIKRLIEPSPDYVRMPWQERKEAGVAMRKRRAEALRLAKDALRAAGEVV